MMMKKTWISNTMLPFLGCWGLYDCSRNLDAVKSSKFEESPVANPVLLCAHRRRVMTFNWRTLSFHIWLSSYQYSFYVIDEWNMDIRNHAFHGLTFILKHNKESWLTRVLWWHYINFAFSRLYQGLEWVASQINSRWWSHVRSGGE